jgi:hypothetical protein
MISAKYIVKDAPNKYRFTPKYDDMLKYIVKYTKEGKDKYRFTEQYYDDMQKKIEKNVLKHLNI